MSRATVLRVEASADLFARHHGLELAKVGDVLALQTSANSGGVGDILPIQKIGATVPRRGLVAKVFNEDVLASGGGPGPIIDTLSRLYGALEQRGGAGWQDAILALPYVLLTTQLDGLDRLVALMLDIGAIGYEECPLADLAGRRVLLKRPMDERICLAIACLQRLELLERIGFVHADINPPNLFYDPVTGDFQIIDFDSGAVVVNGSERPRTCGKPDEFMPPEVKTPGLGIGSDPALYTRESERWAYGSLAGMFLFAAHPGFFLDEISGASIAAYGKAPERWPEIDVNGPLFTSEPVNQRAYSRMRSELASVPAEVKELFALFFDAGLDGGGRPTASDWLTGLKGLRNPPVIDMLMMSDDFVLEGEDVTVTWRALNATHVELVPGGRQPAVGSLSIPVQQTVRVTITAHNAFGEHTLRGPLVRTIPLPVLRMVPLPEFPAFPQIAPVSLAGSGAFETVDSPVLPPPSLACVFACPAATRSPDLPELPEFPRLPELASLTSRFDRRRRKSW